MFQRNDRWVAFVMLLLFTASIVAGIEIRHQCRLGHARAADLAWAIYDDPLLLKPGPDPVGLNTLPSAEG